jgi:DNA-binding beta-propeller fold protein YncE
VNTGSKSNPYQVALLDGKAFVARYGSAHLLILDAGRKDGGTRDSIDLSAWAADSLKGTPGAVPHMAAAVAHGGKVFVAVQRLTGWTAKDTSKVLIIDAASRKVTGSIDLLRKNPVAVAALGRYLYVSCVEGYGSFTGAVERIDMQEGKHAGLVVEEKDLDPPSDLSSFVPVSDSKGYAIHSPDFENGHISEIGMARP